MNAWLGMNDWGFVALPERKERVVRDAFHVRKIGR
jgi:hypothetical protein